MTAVLERRAGRPLGVDWEACSTAEVEPLLGGPGSFLAAEELALLAALKTEKRRLEWLAGRLAAKRLMKRVLGGAAGSECCASEAARPVLLSDVRVLSDSDRAPFVALPWPEPRERFPISITHSDGLAVCALGPAESRVGIDLERVEVRHRAWLEIAFHDSERDAGFDADPAAQTAAWTVKEAVLKLLGLGLSSDLWDVRRSPAPAAPGRPAVRLFGKARAVWESLGGRELSLETSAPEAGRVLTVAVAGAGMGRLASRTERLPR